MHDTGYKMQEGRWLFKRIRIWKYKNEFIRFLTFALASCDETKEHLRILSETGSLKDNDKFNSFVRRYEELGRKIHNFIKAVESAHKS